MAKAGPFDAAIEAALAEMKKRAMSVAPMIMNEIVKKMQLKFDDCIDSFYADYSPWYYKRTYSSYLAVSSTVGELGSLCNVSDSGTAVVITAGIDVDGSRLGNPYYHDSGEYVFNRTWQWGIHGAMFTGGIMSPPPKMIMDKWFADFVSSREPKAIANKWLKTVGLILN